MEISEALKLEAKLGEIKRGIVDEIKRDLDNAHPENYHPINSFSGVVKASDLFRSPSWAPEYFIPKAQAEIVELALKRADSISSLRRKIEEMIEGKSVVHSGTKYALNPTTVNILKRHSV